ncbi:MAG: glycosyl transferase family 2 [Microgenomates bacterium 39_6]|nr:MAG: glycosyl transferase family 2 [Microgenomates bacterium 39_6]
MATRKKSPSVFLSIVIPCYNESANLKRGVLTQVEAYLKKQKYLWEVIISDDGSTDNSRQLVKKFIKDKSGFVLLENRHGGKPYAVWQGIKKAKGEIILFTDMDQSTPLKEIEKLLPFFDQGFEVVIGSRGIRREGFPLYRQAASFIFLSFRRLLVLPNIKDTQCGFKAFRAEAAKKLFPKLSVLANWQEASGWRVTAFDVELLFLAQKFGYSIKEVVVDWQDEDIATGKNKSFVKESRQMLEQIINVKKNDRQGKYEKQAPNS